MGRACMAEKRNAYRVFVRKHEGRDHTERTDNIKTYLTETGLEGVD